jgi:hypothetical protein
MNRKIVVLVLGIVIATGIGAIAYQINNNRPSQRNKEIAKKIDEYYKAKPRQVSEKEVDEANAKLDPAPADSICRKLGFEYQVTSSDGSAVCTVGYH